MSAPATPIVLGLAVAGFLESCGGKANEFQPPPPPTVTVQEPSVRDVVVFTDFTGRTEAIETVEVRARVKGFLDKMLFNPSGQVTKDDVLFEIQPDEFLAAVHAAEAREDQTQAALDLAQVKLEKAQRAFDQDAATDLEIRQFTAERDAMLAELEAAKANVASVNLDLDYTKVLAPISGRVSREYVSIGNLVGAGEATLLTIIVIDDPMYAYFNVDERALIEILRERDQNRPAEGNEQVSVKLQLADGTDYALDGKVDFGENRVDPTTGTLQVRAVFPNPDGQLFPGLFARVRIPRELDEAVLIPEIAIQRDIVGDYVLVVDRDGTVERVDVELGPQVERERVIKSGLRGREAVIVNGIQRARPGITVTAEEADEDDEDDAPSMEDTEETEG